MTLVTRFLAARRDKLLMKAGCWLVCFSLVLGLMLPQQRAEALVAELTMASVAGAAAAYLCACGMPFVTQGMDKDALVSSVQRLIQEFLDTELGGITIQDWLGTVWDVAVLAGKLIMGRPLTDKMMVFAQWVAGKYGVQQGENVVYSDQSITFVDGSTYTLTSYTYEKVSGNLYKVTDYIRGTSVPLGTDVNPFSIRATSDRTLTFYKDYHRIYTNGVNVLWFDWTSNKYEQSVFMAISFIDGSLIAVLPFSSDYISKNPNGSVLDFNLTAKLLTAEDLEGLLYGTDLSIDRAPSMSYIPEGIEAEQGIALDVGAAETMNLDMVLQGVLDDVIAGALTSTMTAAGEEVVDPPAEEIPDVDNLGLPALGAALTSRFPFSIPWDFFRAVQLLAAPAKAPYFEVDFMEPLADDVGGWQGDTTVILDFSEYAIIGQISRWTSTIGFCLMLAGATKRLIWTA